MFHREPRIHVTSATKRTAIALKDDNDDDDCMTCPSTLSDQEPPEVVRRRAPPLPELEKNADDELMQSARSPTGSDFQPMTSTTGVAAPPPLATYRSTARILAPPPPSAAAFQLAAFHSIYASQQQQQHQMRQSHQMSPSLRFSLFTDASSAPGTLCDRIVSFFTARCYAERGYATVTRLSVCPSVTLRSDFHTGRNTSRLNSLRYLLTLTTTRAIWSNGNTPKIGWHRLGSGARKTCNISETVQCRTKVTMINRKSHTRFRLVQKSMTSDDLMDLFINGLQTTVPLPLPFYLERPKRHSCRNRTVYGAHHKNFNKDRCIVLAAERIGL